MGFKLNYLTTITILAVISSVFSKKHRHTRDLEDHPGIEEDYMPTNPKEDTGDLEFERNPEEEQEEEIPYDKKDLETVVEEHIENHKEMDTLPDDIEKAEYIEDVSSQLYLMYIDDEDRYWLDLFMFDKQLKNEEVADSDSLDYNCPKMLFKAMGLTGYYNPILKDNSIEDCPHMEMTCCTGQDFIELDDIWEEGLKQKTEMNYFYMEYFVKNTLKFHHLYLAAAENLKEMSSDPFCLHIADSFINTPMDDAMAQKSEDLLAQVKEFDYRVKKSYNCLVCNHENIR